MFEGIICFFLYPFVWEQLLDNFAVMFQKQSEHSWRERERDWERDDWRQERGSVSLFECDGNKIVIWWLPASHMHKISLCLTHTNVYFLKDCFNWYLFYRISKLITVMIYMMPLIKLSYFNTVFVNSIYNKYWA